MTFDLRSRTHLVSREEVLVSVLEDVELGVVQPGVVVDVAVPLPHKAAHAGPPLRGELAVEDQDDAPVRPGRDHGVPEQHVFHLLLLVQVQGSLRRRGTDRDLDQPGLPSISNTRFFLLSGPLEPLPPWTSEGNHCTPPAPPIFFFFKLLHQ